MYTSQIQPYSDSHGAFKFAFNVTVLILPLGICVRTLIVTVLRYLQVV